MNQLNGEIIEIGLDGQYLLQRFLNAAGSSLVSFRYFANRSFDVLSDHLITVLFMIDDTPVGYGHLDKEENKVWLGICVAEGFGGLGIGKQIMSYLDEAAVKFKIDQVYLSVDRENLKAQNLYNKCGFRVTENYESGNLIFMRKSYLK